MALLAEELLLLLLDDEDGSLAASPQVAVALGGALLAELALDGRVEVGEKQGLWRQAKVKVTGPAPDDRVLAAAHATVAEKERTTSDLVSRLGRGVKEQLLDRLAGRGILERRTDRVLGLLPRTRWPAVDSAHEDLVRRTLTSTLVSGASPEPRTAALVSLLSALGRAHRTVDPGPVGDGEVRRRAREIAEGGWAAQGVADAIAATNTAITAAVAAAVTTTTTT